jgi:tetratricopeptide (TPR) repeat protein
MLVGRDAEQRRLDLLIGQAHAGISGVLVLRGDPGIGKTALLDYARSGAGPMRVLRATGIQAETGLAFAGLYSLLHPVLGHLGTLPGPHAVALRAALGLSHDVAVPGRLAVAAGTHGLLITAAEGDPLLILVDDLHWLDPGSQEALLFTLRRLGHDAIACVMTLRGDVPAPAGLPCRDLGGLGRDAAEQLVEAVAGIRPAPAVAGRLHAETGGNPLALRELAAMLTAEQLGGAQMPAVPLDPGAAIRSRFAARIDQLSPSARTAVLVAAAAGRCPAAEVSAAAARLNGGDSQALGEAEGAGLVRVTAEGVEFSHPLLCSVAYHTASPALRRAAHRALADVLAGRDAERAAWQLAAAATGPDDAAATTLDAVAGLAARRGAPLAAAAAWLRAAELSGVAERRSGRLAAAAEAALAGGDLDQARRLTEPLPGAEQPILRSRSLAVQGSLDMLAGRMTAAQQTLQEAADLTADADPGRAVELLARSVTAAVEGGLFEDASRAAERMAGLAGQSDQAARFLADLAYGGLAWRRGDAERGMRLISRAASSLEAHPVLASASERQLDVASAWCSAGYLDRARPYADRAVGLARSEGAVGRLPDALQWAAGMAKETGRWAQALADGSQALDLALASGQTFLACNALVIIAEVEAAQGRDEDCRQHARQADRLADEAGLRLLQVRARLMPALLEFGRGRLEEAIAHYEAVRKLAAGWGIGHSYYSPIPNLIEAYARAGALDRARALLPEHLAQVPGDANPPSAAGAASAVGSSPTRPTCGYTLHPVFARGPFVDRGRRSGSARRSHVA